MVKKDFCNIPRKTKKNTYYIQMHTYTRSTKGDIPGNKACKMKQATLEDTSMKDEQDGKEIYL